MRVRFISCTIVSAIDRTACRVLRVLRVDIVAVALHLPYRPRNTAKLNVDQANVTRPTG